MGLSPVVARVVLAALFVPPSTAGGRTQAPTGDTPPTVQSLTRAARKLRAEAEAAAASHSPEAAEKHAAAASAWDEALLLERETETTWERRHSIFCDGSADWLKAFDLGLRALSAAERAAAAARDYSDALQRYPDRDTRQPTCQASQRLERANQIIAEMTEEARAAKQTEEAPREPEGTAMAPKTGERPADEVGEAHATLVPPARSSPRVCHSWIHA